MKPGFDPPGNTVPGDPAMNTIQRVGLVVSGAAAVLTVGAALVVQGYTGALETAQAAVPVPTAAPTDTPAAEPSLDPSVIYVLPQATPPIITITTTAPPVKAAVPAAPPVIHVIVPAPPGGDDEGEDEGDDD
jgi:hypothetical protein